MLIQQLLILAEARKKNVSYDLVEVKGKVEKVVAKLEGTESASFTVLAKKFRTLHTQINELSAELETQKTGLKEKMQDYFDAEDEVLTRVLETCSLSMMLSKASPPGTSVDYEVAFNSFVTQLVDMVPELKNKVAKLQDAVIASSSKKTAGRKAAFKVEPVKEGVVKNVAEYFKNLLSSLKTWGTKYDAKLAKLKELSIKLK